MREALFLIAVFSGICATHPVAEGRWMTSGKLCLDSHQVWVRGEPDGPEYRGSLGPFGVNDVAPSVATIALELPPELRTRNWGGGSCVHASHCNLLIWNGLFDLAKWWRSTYIGGEYDSRLIKRMESAKLRYVYVHAGSDRNGNGKDDGEEFIEWACKTRRGAGIFYKPMHSINCVGIDRDYVYLLDNNATDYPERVGHYERVPRADFFRMWKNQYGGFAWSLVYLPPPTAPKG